MSLSRLFPNGSPRDFLRDYFLKQPFSLAGAARDLASLGTWETVEAILRQEGVDSMLARQGSLWDGEAAPDFAHVRELHAQGYTLVIRHAERHDARLRELAEGFEREFRAAVNIHVYCTPENQYGFGWHYDAEEVFIVQTQGEKEYSLRKNTVNPWPLAETMPRDLRYEREIMPLAKCNLAAGDWLYIPAGYWHRGQSGPAAISLALGVMTATALDALDLLRRRLTDSLLWRQRLPVAAPGEVPQDVMQQYREIFAELGQDLAKQLESEAFVQEILAREEPPRTERLE